MRWAIVTVARSVLLNSSWWPRKKHTRAALAVGTARCFVDGSSNTYGAAFLTGQIAPSLLYCWLTIFLQRSRWLFAIGGWRLFAKGTGYGARAN